MARNNLGSVYQQGKIKLYAFTHPYVNDYCYPLGVHLILETNAFLVIWFVAGRVKTCTLLSYNPESSKWMKKKTSISSSNDSSEYPIQIPEYSITSIKNSFKQLKIKNSHKSKK